MFVGLQSDICHVSSSGQSSMKSVGSNPLVAWVDCLFGWSGCLVGKIGLCCYAMLACLVWLV